MAVGLILVLSLSGDAFSRAEPFNMVKPYIDPDDHTWGGDQPAGSSDRSVGNPGDPYVGWVTGITPWDVFFNSIFRGSWWYLKIDSSPTKQNDVPAAVIRSNSDERNLEVSSNNKGN
jgi:hypothetical protein